MNGVTDSISVPWRRIPENGMRAKGAANLRDLSFILMKSPRDSNCPQRMLIVRASSKVAKPVCRAVNNSNILLSLALTTHLRKSSILSQNNQHVIYCPMSSQYVLVRQDNPPTNARRRHVAGLSYREQKWTCFDKTVLQRGRLSKDQFQQCWTVAQESENEEREKSNKAEYNFTGASVS
ncbi:hypothetical protein RRG08_065217 [Elysia crispata]|uniref:Uncharacterized protein n=1 Tax=Elysia crispata TaxID=231223 RepID=A0AAE1CZK6_9GAST|nr:hypothetical protein RRG08_065217 [Elysia crispata]